MNQLKLTEVPLIGGCVDVDVWMWMCGRVGSEDIESNFDSMLNRPVQPTLRWHSPAQGSIDIGQGFMEQSESHRTVEVSPLVIPLESISGLEAAITDIEEGNPHANVSPGTLPDAGVRIYRAQTKRSAVKPSSVTAIKLPGQVIMYSLKRLSAASETFNKK
ncbi:hypothetical protein RRG08_053989 [Elysia crispata]|uniref:Uncharacterized protein n=1 Tax=Elysia crispata TaxID=231223 RepID=A0AAE1BB14_9GAST|nr:hypothetical protein RRG08_053989 [Elysia crispata]